MATTQRFAVINNIKTNKQKIQTIEKLQPVTIWHLETMYYYNYAITQTHALG